LLTALAAAYFAGASYMAYALTRLDPYPPFMKNRQPVGSQSYDAAIRKFSEFVVEAFPLGSDAKDAVALLTGSGFQIAKSNAGSVELVWNRRAGPCSERHSIVISQTADGKIANVAGRLDPICL
jgi:hypothetical protein